MAGWTWTVSIYAWDRAEVTGSLALGASRVQGELVLAPLPLKSLAPFGVPPMGGTAGARVTLAGTRAAPELTMRGTVADVAVDRAAKSKVNGSLNAQVAGGRLQSDLALTGLGSEPLTAQASLPVTFNLDPGAFALAANASLSGHLAGPIDLARLARFIVLDGTQVSGVLSTGLDLSGTLQNPRLDGTATLDKGVVQDLATGLNLREVTLHAQAQGDRLAIETLQATDQAGGKFSGQGAVRLLAGGGIGYDLSAKAGRARVLDNTLGVVVLSGDASVTGTLAKALARGAFTVDSADLQIPNSLGPSVPTIKVREVRDGSPVIQSAAPSTPFDLGFDVKVDIPGRFFVRGRGLDSEWTGKLSLKGDLADPLIEGELDVRRGRLDLLDRRFNIDRGAIDFVGSRPPIPMIDLAATATTAEVTVTVAIQGPAADPKIKLSSEPTLPQDEILSRLLFGTSVAKITPMQGLRLAAAVNDLQGDGFVTSTLTKLRRAVGLDTIDVESTESTDQNGETTQQTNAKVGKYITDKVYLEAQRGVTDGTNKARVKVDLTPNLSVGSSVTDQAQTGVGIQWRYDY